MHGEKLIILDFGSKSSSLLARRFRECGVYCEILPADTPSSRIKCAALQGIIVTGDTYSADKELLPQCNRGIFELGVPVLGIGCGIEIIAALHGGGIARKESGNSISAPLHIQEQCPLWKNYPDGALVMLNTSTEVSILPDGFTLIGSTAQCRITAIADIRRRIYAVQFYPELEQSVCGTQLLKNFARDICGCVQQWNAASGVEMMIAEIKETVGNRKVLSALSGGVDSSVASVLVHKAVGEQLTCIFVDHGLLRKNEAAEILKTYRETLGLHIIHADAADRFLQKLHGICDPEQKRKIIGEEFIRVFEEEAKKIGATDYLVQGTIYPDVIESGSGKKDSVIKTHHNVGGLPERIAFKALIEPLRMLFKDEVRLLGKALGIPEPLVNRQPFPGPGLAVRILGEITPERLQLVRESDAILREEIAKAGLAESIWQYFTVLPNVHTVGVTDHGRTYNNLIAIRAVTSTDAMTVEPAEIPYPVLKKIVHRIVSEVSGINRVVYDITPKPPATIEWE